MIPAQHTKFHTWFFRHYSVIMLKRYFKKIEIFITEFDANKSILLIGNHFSWWDGFIANYLNDVIFHKKFHIMMLEDQLKNRKFLSKAGAFSINLGNRAIKESIGYAIQVLNNNNNMLVLFPQGKILSQHTYPVKFEKGWLSIPSNAKQLYELIFMVNLTEYFSEKKPSLYIFFKNYKFQPDENIQHVEEGYNRFFSECIHELNKDRK